MNNNKITQLYSGSCLSCCYQAFPDVEMITDMIETFLIPKLYYNTVRHSETQRHILKQKKKASVAVAFNKDEVAKHG